MCIVRLCEHVCVKNKLTQVRGLNLDYCYQILPRYIPAFRVRDRAPGVDRAVTELIGRAITLSGLLLTHILLFTQKVQDCPNRPGVSLVVPYCHGSFVNISDHTFEPTRSTAGCCFSRPTIPAESYLGWSHRILLFHKKGSMESRTKQTSTPIIARVQGPMMERRSRSRRSESTMCSSTIVCYTTRSSVEKEQPRRCSFNGLVHQTVQPALTDWSSRQVQLTEWSI